MAVIPFDAGDWMNPKTLKASFGFSFPPPAEFADGLKKFGVDDIRALELPQDVKERVIAALDAPQGASADKANAVRKILMDAGIDILVYPNLVEGSSRGAPSFIAINPKAILSLDGKPIGESAENFAFTGKYENADARRAAADGLRKEGKSPQDIWTETGLVRFDGEWLAEVPGVELRHPGISLTKQGFNYEGRHTEATMFPFSKFFKNRDKASLALERLTLTKTDGGVRQDLWVAVMPNMNDFFKSKATAFYSRNNHVIFLDKGWLESPKGGRSKEELHWVMNHEVQHAIDKVEGRDMSVVEFDGESFMHEIAYDFSPSERRARAASRRMLTTNLEWLPDFNIGKDGFTLPKRGLKKMGDGRGKGVAGGGF